MVEVIIYFGVWFFFASIFETALAKCLWTAIWFAPLVWEIIVSIRKKTSSQRSAAKPKAAVNPSDRVNAGSQVPKRFSKAVSKSAVKFPVQNRAGRIVPISFRKRIHEAALVMAPRNVRPWHAVPAGKRNRACREYFAYRLRLPWILEASPELLGIFLFGYLTWPLYRDGDMYKSTDFVKAGEKGNVF